MEESTYTAIEGIKELLEELQSNKVPIGIALSPPWIFIEAVIKKIKIAKYFKNLISGEEVPKSKPEPDVFFRVADLLKVNPEKFIVIEDSKNVTIAAIRAGMKCIGYRNINSGNQDLSKADKIVEKISEIDYKEMK